MANREREDNIYYARLAEQGERYEDMIRYMKEVSAVSTRFRNSFEYYYYLTRRGLCDPISNHTQQRRES